MKKDFQQLRMELRRSAFLDKIIGNMGLSEKQANDRLFIHRIYSEGIEKYIKRLQSIGFVSSERILDAGCGYGQWSLALARLNQQVYGCEISDLRLSFIRRLTSEYNIQNLQVQKASIEDLPYPDSFFDKVFCYGVVLCSDWKNSILEFKRVLKPGGKLYVNANEIGWYVFLWETEHNKSSDYDPRAVVAKVFSDTHRYNEHGIHSCGDQLLVRQKELALWISNAGFKIQIGPEGSIAVEASAPQIEPFLLQEYEGMPAVYEILGTLN